MRRGNKDRLTNRIVQMAGAVRLPVQWEGETNRRLSLRLLSPRSYPLYTTAKIQPRHHYKPESLVHKLHYTPYSSPYQSPYQSPHKLHYTSSLEHSGPFSRFLRPGHNQTLCPDHMLGSHAYLRVKVYTSHVLQSVMVLRDTKFCDSAHRKGSTQTVLVWSPQKLSPVWFRASNRARTQ